MVKRGAGVWGFIVALLLAPLAAAAEPNTTVPSEAELASWLAADQHESLEVTSDESSVLEPPLPAPRRHGFSIAGSVGALGHLGDMQTVSPVSPWFRLQLGYDVFDWLTVLAEGDIAVSSTALANRPPEKRSYALFGVGAAARLSWQPWTVLGFHIQGDLGLSSVNQDVLSTYGYPDADRARPYLGGELGLDWFQVSPHYALSLQGGVRNYISNFDRVNGTKPPLAWTSALAIRYTL